MVYIVYRQVFLGPVDPSFRALSGRLKFTVRRHKFNKDSFSTRSLDAAQLGLEAMAELSLSHTLSLSLSLSLPPSLPLSRALSRCPAAHLPAVARTMVFQPTVHPRVDAEQSQKSIP